MEITCLHNYHGHDKLYVVRIDQVGGEFVVTGSWGAAKKAKLADDHKGSFPTLHAAQRVAEELIRSKARDGYERAAGFEYRGMREADILKKITDLSRVVGNPAALPQPSAAAVPSSQAIQPKARKASAPQPARAARTLSI